MDRYICIHGHFYQPPRENPWLEEVELQDTAYPYHDWNERISAECYAPNAASRILDQDERIVDIVNNYAKISFNFGPTLLSWLERHEAETYQAILEADRLSMERFSGHGSAMAQVYNHMIMPLASQRDKITQVSWGIQDFVKRFRRSPEGMWLPETAVDLKTLEILAEFGVRFTVLAPHQIRRVKKISGGRWHDMSGGKIDPTMAYLCQLPSGRTIHIFVYDGPIARDVAFGGLLSNGEAFAKRLVGAFSEGRSWPQIVHIATDGETYGHHHRFGDMALAYGLHYIEFKNLARLTNYGEYLERHPPTHLVEILENTSWSCVHGVERWRDNCGCRTGSHPGWTQAWRRPLREAMDWLRDRTAVFYEQATAGWLRDPWRARDEYIEVIFDRSQEHVEQFLRRHAAKELRRDEMGRLLKLLEMQRHAMLMYTSCGWFFDEISGIETVQVMQYAARVMQLAEETQAVHLEPEYISRLAVAPSNYFKNGAEVYEKFIKPARVDLLRVGAHYAISSLFEEYPQKTQIYCYSASSEVYDRFDAGRLKLAIGKARIHCNVTWDEEIMSFAVLHLGDHNINGGVRLFREPEAFSTMHAEIRTAFERGDVPEVIRLIHHHFNTHTYSAWHLFKDEQRKVLDGILEMTYENIAAAYRQIHEDHYGLMNFLTELQIPLPKPLRLASEFVINNGLRNLLRQEDPDLEKLERLIGDARRWGLELDAAMLGYTASSRVELLFKQLHQHPEDTTLLERIETLIKLLTSIPIELNLWKAQNLYFSIGKQVFSKMRDSAEQGQEQAKRWVEQFRKLGYRLRVKVF